jgi:hypothetical protein
MKWDGLLLVDLIGWKTPSTRAEMMKFLEGLIWEKIHTLGGWEDVEKYTPQLY